MRFSLDEVMTYRGPWKWGSRLGRVGRVLNVRILDWLYGAMGKLHPLKMQTSLWRLSQNIAKFKVMWQYKWSEVTALSHFSETHAYSIIKRKYSWAPSSLTHSWGTAGKQTRGPFVFQPSIQQTQMVLSSIILNSHQHHFLSGRCYQETCSPWVWSAVHRFFNTK